MNEILQNAEKDKSQGSIRNFFKTIKKYSTFNPTLKAIKDSDGTILMEPEKKIVRWKEYFVDLLNGTILTDPIENATYQKAEPFIKEISKEEVKEAIKNLKNWKAPGSDSIPSELIKFGGKDIITSFTGYVIGYGWRK